MKILAVRGKNLASLAGRFAVEFAAAPLDRAGLIAITGPTGAGKTTLLDAMCLALFDRTPRLAQRGGVVIGAQDDDPTAGLKANDVRGILRHGASEGWAEVEFLGVDERRWRARWELRRARGRADGRLQQQTMQLFDVAADRLVAGDRKSDVLAAIEARLGLDFDQFRRSVLLAQGEFAAFLEASGTERAELLERMTGTGLYRQLGKAAFERAKAAEAELGLLRRERDGLAVLPDEARTELRAAAERCRQRATQLDARRTAAEAALRWYAREAELDAALRAARVERDAALQTQADEAPTALLLARVERVIGLRERVEQRDRVAAELAERRQELEFLRGDLPHVDARIAGLREQLREREQARARAQERRRRLAPELDQARALDGRLATSRERQAQLTASRAEVEAQQRAGAAALARVDADGQQLAGALAQLDARLRADQALAPISADWAHYQALLQQQRRDLGRRAAFDQRRALLGPRRERAEQDIHTAKQELGDARKRRSQARQRLKKVARDLDALASLAALRLRQQRLESSRERLAALRELQGRGQRAADEHDALVREREECAAEAAAASAEEAALGREIAAAERGFDEAQRGLRQLEAVRDLISHRQDLRPGEACPVCGATEHPAAGELAPVDAVLDEQRARVRELLARRDRLQARRGELAGRARLAQGRAAALGERIGAHERQRLELQQAWAEARGDGALWLVEDDAELDGGAHGDEQLSLLGGAGLARVTIPSELADPGLARILWSLEDQLARRWRALADERRAVEALLETQRDLQARSDQAEAEHEQRRVRVEAAERERELLIRELDEVGRALAELADDLAERALGLAPVAALTDPARPADPGALTRALEARGAELILELDAAVREHRGREAERGRLVEAARQLDLRQRELASAAQARRERAAELDRELAALDAALAQLDQDRAGLLGGRSVADVVRELDGAVALAERDYEASKDALAREEQARTGLHTRLRAVEDLVEGLAARRVEVVAGLRAAQVEAGVDDEELAELLGRAQLWRDGWIAAARGRVQASQAAVDRSAAVLGERERVLAEHRATGRPSLEPDAAAQARAADEQALQAVRAELFELDHRLRRDDERRAALAELGPRLVASERAASLWGRLRDAIGSATGDKFQKFAQSLTLELLLAQANAQLRELKPRYALQRVPKHDLELQLVDHDLGDEIRSIRGLSGGEKFLVSLALALALASLAAEDCRIDSLFIDEGFGTLDPQSLDVAVSTLDALQGEGRQIGVISHVPGLAERVGVEIRVEPVSSGRSRIFVAAGAALG